MARIWDTDQRIRALMHSNLVKQDIPDFTAFYLALHALAAEVLPEIGWRQLEVEGQYRGGNQDAWHCWLSELGATYKGVVRLQRTILAVAYATDHTTLVKEIRVA